MRNPNAAGPVLLVAGALYATRYIGYLLLAPVVCLVWWEAGPAGLVKVALIVFWSRQAIRSYRRLRQR